MKVRFWGVRGSTPTPTMENFRYGGNTSCIEVRTPQGEILIFDCGTGLRLLGKQLLSEFGHKNIQANLFLTHYHWDHIQGIPFFEPLYNPENSFSFHSFPSHARGVQEALEEQMSDPYFPVNMSTMEAHRHFYTLEKDSLSIQDALLKTIPLNHPQGCLGYRLECGNRVVVYATDNEPGSPEHDRNVRKLAEGADVFIYDGQYTPYEYANFKKGWGHSTWREAVTIAQEARVQQLVLFHHDPDHNDNFLDSMLDEARRFFPNTVAAWEGMDIDVGSNEHAQPRNQAERRHGNRRALRIPARVRGRRLDGTPFAEETILENLSVDGAYFLLENDPDTVSPLQVEFTVPSGLTPEELLQPLKSRVIRKQGVTIAGKSRSGVAVIFQ